MTPRINTSAEADNADIIAALIADVRELQAERRTVPTIAGLDSKVAKAGDTMTGSLLMADGSAQVSTRVVRTNNGQSLVLMGGESASYADLDDVNSEYVYALSDSGFQVLGSPNNWSTGWADRQAWMTVSQGITTLRGPNSATPAKILFRAGDGSSDIGTMLDFNNGAYTAGVQAGRLALKGDIGIAINTSYGYTWIGALNSSHSQFYTDRSGYYFNKRIIVDEGIISSWNEDLILQRAQSTHVQIAGAANNSYAYFYSPYSANTQGPNSTDRCAVIIRTRNDSNDQGEQAGIAFWTQYSTDRHVELRVHYNGGDEIGARNWENTLWAGYRGSYFAVASDEKYKDRIRRGRDEHHPLLEGVLTGDRDGAYDRHQSVEPIIFDDVEQEYLTRWLGCPNDLHEEREGCTADSECDGEHNIEKYHHICDDLDWCNGTNEHPCWMIERHVDRNGFSAQNVMDAYPKTVNRFADGTELSIDTHALVAEHWNTTDFLIDDVRSIWRTNRRQRNQIATLSKRNKRLANELTQTQDRLAAIEARLSRIEEPTGSTK